MAITGGKRRSAGQVRTNPAPAYLIPDFHNPTGLLMPDDQRERLARVLRSSGCVAVVVGDRAFGLVGW